MQEQREKEDGKKRIKICKRMEGGENKRKDMYRRMR
jgi:hypothetical protein